MDDLRREGSRSLSFLGQESAFSTLQYFAWLKVKEWLMERHSEHWVATRGMRQSEIFIERPYYKTSSDLMPCNRKKCRLVRGLLTGHCTLRQHLLTTSLSENIKCRKCRREEIVLLYKMTKSLLARYRSEIFGSAWLQ